MMRWLPIFGGVVAVAACARPPATPGNPDLGRLLLQQYGCIDCHRIAGVAGRQREVGPPLEGLAGRLYLAGRLPNDFDTLVGFIRDPQASVPGTSMPTLGLSPTQASDIAAYLWASPSP